MLSDNAVQYVTKAKWLQALSTYKEHGRPPAYARGRRKHVRFKMEGWATLTCEPPDEFGEPTVCQGCQVLDVSEEGVALRASRKIESDTPVSIELHVSGRIFWLLGKVVYHRAMAGSNRIGIKLEFDAADSQDKAEVG
jgi:hypothetical protein